jgi:hypothetical protein
MPLSKWLNPQLTMGTGDPGNDNGNGGREDWLRRHRVWIILGTSIAMWALIAAVIVRVLYRLGVLG